MNWTTLICFGVGIGIYLLGLGVFTLIKHARNKKKFAKEVKEHEEQEAKSQQDENSAS